MTRQVFLVTAYRDCQALLALTRTLRSLGDVFIHIDTKSRSIDERCLTELHDLGAFSVRTHSINHGSFRHVLAVIELLRLAHQSGAFSYAHLISGQDFPCRSKADFERFFQNSQGSIYIQALNLETSSSRFKRRLHFNYYHGNANRRNLLVKGAMLAGIVFQSALGTRNQRLGKFDTVYLGLLWSSLPSDAVDYVVNYLDLHPEYLDSLSKTYIPEEFFLQTILMNSRFRNRVTGEHLRYSKWGEKRGQGPGVLRELDIAKIDDSEAFFCRKISFPESASLVALLLERWKSA